jgi:hypothetical protein
MNLHFEIFEPGEGEGIPRRMLNRTFYDHGVVKEPRLLPESAKQFAGEFIQWRSRASILTKLILASGDTTREHSRFGLEATFELDLPPPGSSNQAPMIVKIWRNANVYEPPPDWDGLTNWGPFNHRVRYLSVFQKTVTHDIGHYWRYE